MASCAPGGYAFGAARFLNNNWIKMISLVFPANFPRGTRRAAVSALLLGCAATKPAGGHLRSVIFLPQDMGSAASNRPVPQNHVEVAFVLIRGSMGRVCSTCCQGRGSSAAPGLPAKKSDEAWVTGLRASIEASSCPASGVIVARLGAVDLRLLNFVLAMS